MKTTSEDPTSAITWIIPFEIDIPLYLGVILVVCAIIGATMLYAVSRLKDDSIVETLKEEIG